MMMTPRALSHHSVYRRPRRTALLTALVAAFGWLFLVFAPPASAHTALLKSTPEKGSTVSAVPEVILVFNEPVRMAKILVRDSAGATHQQGTPRADGATLTQPVAAGLTPGEYTVAYRVVSSDGHVVEDQFGFTLSGAARPGAATTPGGASSTPAADAAKAGDAGKTKDTKGDENTAESKGIEGGARWSIIMGGLVIGVGIGMGIVFLRKRPGAPGTPGTPGGPGGDQSRDDDQRGPSGGN